MADIFQFQVPPSHRRAIGKAITAAKRGILNELKPLHAHLLAPQREFNLALAEEIRKLTDRDSSRRRRRVPDTRDRLLPLTNPARWSWEARNATTLDGSLRGWAHRSYLSGLRPLLRDILERQRLWNVEALETVARLGNRPAPSGEELDQRLQLLGYLSGLRPQVERRSAEWLLSPLWEEIFRRQHAFNAEAVRLIGVAAQRPELQAPAELPHPPPYYGPVQRMSRAFARRTFPFRVVALDNVVEAGVGQFECVGADPKLSLVPREGQFPHGWTRMRMQVSGLDRVDLSWRLYFDTGAGFREDESRPLPISSGREGALEFIQFLPPHLRGLRLDPTEDARGRFILSDVAFQEVTKQEALVSAYWNVAREEPITPRHLVKLGHQVVQGVRRGGIARAVDTLHARTQYPPYAVWVRRFDTLSDDDRAAIRRRIDRMKTPPLISVVMPVYDTPEEDLRRAIDSVRKQLYPRWELCIADDCSSQPHVRGLLEQAAASDERIKVAFRDANGHISAASNTALAMARGDFVALLDHDDELTEHALYMVAEEVGAHPDAGVIYSDEDKIDETGRRHDPYFKPDWNPDLLRSQNYVSHLGVYRRSLLEKVGGFRVGFEGSQDYDVLLRVVELLKPAQIRHIPHVLYHWRSSANSSALAGNTKPYAHKAGERALAEHLTRTGQPATVRSISEVGRYRVRYALPASPPLVSLIVPTRDRLDLLQPCVESILEKTGYPAVELLVVDNRSEEEATFRFLRKIDGRHGVRVLRYDHPFNYSAINNYAVAKAKGAIVGLVNNDIEVTQGEWLQEMVSQALRPEIGAVGARLLFPNQTVQHAGVVLGIGGIAGHAHKHLPTKGMGYFDRAQLLQNYSAVTAACLLARKSAYEEVGGLDVALRVAFNDVDFCLRLLERGYLNVWTPYAELVHHESATRGADIAPEKAARFAREIELMEKRWRSLIPCDPNYNPNLSLLSEDFALAFPPRASNPWNRRTTYGSTARPRKRVRPPAQRATPS